MTSHSGVFKLARQIRSVVRASCNNSMSLKLAGLFVLGFLLSYGFGLSCFYTSAMVVGVYLATGGLAFVKVCFKTLPRDIRALKVLLTLKLKVKKYVQEGKSIPQLFMETAKKYPNKPCFIYDDKQWTFQEVDIISNSIGNYFYEAGARQGDVVALVMENRPELVFFWLGLSKIGAVGALINYNLRDKSLLHCISASKASGIVFTAELAQAVGEIESQLPASCQLYFTGTGTSQSPRATNLDPLVAKSPTYPPRAPRCKFTDQLFYVYTSGTTGLPKAAIISHSRFFYMASAVNMFLQIQADDILYNSLPLYHTAGGIIGVGQAFLKGTTVVIKKKFSASGFWDDCWKYKCTVAQYIGEICRYLMAQPHRPSENQHKVRVMFGNGLQPGLWRDFQNRFGVKIMGEFYGATEGNCNIINFNNTIGACGFTSVIAPFMYPVTLIKVDAENNIMRDSNGVCIRAKPGEPVSDKWTVEVYNFGSFSEGTYVASSKHDFDYVYCYYTRPVVTDTTEAKLFQSGFIVVRDQTTFPGYVKLQSFKDGTPLVKGNTKEKIKDLSPDKYGRMCYVFPQKTGLDYHGPSLRFRNSKSKVKVDNLPAYKWRDYPNAYKQWYYRQRLNTMLTTKGLTFCDGLPLLLVPVGHPYSEEREIEWRISYSLHERELMFSLNPTQHKCYVTLKMIKGDILEPVLGKDRITSYHLKTCLFWAIENTPESMWTSDHLLQCICQCLWYLFYFVLKQNCPNYFLPEANLFQRYKFTAAYDSIFALLKDTITELLNVIASIRCADVGVVFSGGYPSISTNKNKFRCKLGNAMFLIGTRSEFDERINSMCYTYHPGEGYMLNSILDVLQNVKRCGEHNECRTITARGLVVPYLHLRLAVYFAAKAFTAQQWFDRLILFKLALTNWEKSSDYDLLNPRLILVTLLYKLGKFTECENILMEIDADMKAHVWSECSCEGPLGMKVSEYIEQLGLSFMHVKDIMNAPIARCVSFMPSDSELVPEPLLLEMGRSEGKKRNTDYTGPHRHQNWSSLDGKVYFHLMRYHVYSRLNKLTEKNECLQHIQTLIDTDVSLRHKDAAYNVIGWMYAQEGKPANAIECWMKSRNLRPHCNAAGRYFSNMLNSFLTLFTNSKNQRI